MVHRKRGWRCSALAALALAGAWPGPVRADQCSDLRAHIAQLDQMIAQDGIRNSRELRIRDRENWARAYNEICTGRSSAGAPAGGRNNAAVLGAAAGMLSILRDMANEYEARRAAEAAEAEQQRLLIERQELLERARREAEELEEKRQAAAARAEDDRKRKALANPWAPVAMAGRANPFDGPGALGGAARPAVPPGSASNPFDAPAPASQPGQSLPAGIKSDAEIRAYCARSRNPGMCELAEQDARSHMPAYQQWKRQQAVQRERDLQRAQARIDGAIAEYRRTRATEAGQSGATGSSAQNFPIEAFRQAEHDRRPVDPDLARCREGAAAPTTVAGCYEQPGGAGRKPTAAAPAAKPKSKKQQLRERVARRNEQRNRPTAGAPAGAAEEAPQGQAAPRQVAAAPARDDGPPAGYRRMEFVDEALCRKWNGRFHSHTPRGVPVCDYPIDPAFTMGADNEQKVRELVNEAQRELGK